MQHTRGVGGQGPFKISYSVQATTRALTIVHRMALATALVYAAHSSVNELAHQEQDHKSTWREHWYLVPCSRNLRDGAWVGRRHV